MKSMSACVASANQLKGTGATRPSIPLLVMACIPIVVPDPIAKPVLSFLNVDASDRPRSAASFRVYAVTAEIMVEATTGAATREASEEIES